MDEEWKGGTRHFRNQVIDQMGGVDGVRKAHIEWLSHAPGRHTKAAR